MVITVINSLIEDDAKLEEEEKVESEENKIEAES